jgi:hypothetical protein
MTEYPNYLDFNATTPVHPIVLEAMLPLFGSCLSEIDEAASVLVSAVSEIRARSESHYGTFTEQRR